MSGHVDDPTTRKTKEEIKDWLIANGCAKIWEEIKDVSVDTIYAFLKDELERWYGGGTKGIGFYNWLHPAPARGYIISGSVFRLWEALTQKKYEEKPNHLTQTTVIELEQGTHWLTGPSSVLFLRSSSAKLLDHLDMLWKDMTPSQTGRKGAIITGNHGIGKSWFLNYLLFVWMTEKRGNVYFESVARNCSLLFTPTGVFMNSHPTSLQPNDLYLFDPYGDVIKEAFRSPAFTVVASCKKSQYKQHFKDVGIKVYLPVWTFEEIEQLYLNIVTTCKKDQLFERFEIFGGIPLFLFAKDAEIVNYRRELDIAIAGTSVSDLQNAGFGLSLDVETSHKVYHLAEVPTEGQFAFSTFNVILASPYVDRGVEEKFIPKYLR